MILMECDDCHTEWTCLEKQPDERCPECDGTAVHWKVTDVALIRIQTLLGQHRVTPERLKAAFASCTAGGETFADAVLARALELGYIELIDGSVRNAANHKFAFLRKQDD